MLLILKDSTAEEITINSLFSHWNKIPNETRTFKETQFDPFLEINHSQSGSLFYKAPNLLEQHYQSPHKGSIIFTNETVKLDFPNRKIELSTENAPMASALSQTLLHLLSGNQAQLKKRFNILYTNLENRGWQLTLIPKVNLKQHIDSIIVTGNEYTINIIQFNQPSGEWRQINFN
ncbi:MAG: outer membrane lipoprotein carrier protein LolA [Pseudomonadota bacterium]|nr:outer membrane lipoprotein carrier protein LolA [Pseudomonadota bacterium]